MKIIYHIYQLCIAAPLIIVATILCALTTIIGCTLGKPRFWGYWPGRVWSIVVCRLLLLPIEVEGREKLDKKSSYVFVANHQGAMDIFLIYGFLGRNFKWMMKKSLKEIPLVGYACQKAGFVFIDRKNPRTTIESIQQARNILTHGMSLMVFPEGTRTFDGYMQPFNKGAFFLADKLHLPVVPITIDGSYDVLPRNKGVGFVARHKMRLVIHDIIPPMKRGADNMSELSRKSFDAINSALPSKYQRETGGDMQVCQAESNDNKQIVPTVADDSLLFSRETDKTKQK